MSILRFLYDQVSQKLKVDFWAFSFHVPQPPLEPPVDFGFEKMVKKWPKYDQIVECLKNSIVPGKETPPIV